MGLIGRPRMYHFDRISTNAERKRAERQRREEEQQELQLLRQKKVKVYHSSLSEEWETPLPLFEQLHEEFGFTIDVAATSTNAKCSHYFTREDNGLLQPWGREICWMNPPYGRALAVWIRKAAESAQAGATVVCLIPARVETIWWHAYIEGKAEVRNLRKRLKFSGAKYNAPFPSVLVIFRPPGGGSHAKDDTDSTSIASTRDGEATIFEAAD